jgi:phenylacetate-CoA ligase
MKDLASAVKKTVALKSPRKIFTTGELLDRATRNFIESAFGAEVIDYYSSLECGNIAWECKRGKGYHINSDSLIVESIRDGKNAFGTEEGEAVITNLHSYAMPFIRYNIGDSIVLSNSKCPCGRSLPLMQSIIGRTMDRIILPSGDKVPIFLLECAIDEIRELTKYQIVQESSDRIVIKLLRNWKINPQILAKLKGICKELLKNKVEIVPLVVDEIPKESSGKYKSVVSKVSG